MDDVDLGNSVVLMGNIPIYIKKMIIALNFAILIFFFQDLLRALSSCMNRPTPTPYQLMMVYDIRSWIEEYAEELHAHTVPKCFKFDAMMLARP